MEVFKEVKALYIMVPALIGLKGNLDMCLASRMSTQANLGNIDSKHEFLKMIIGNVFLVQVRKFTQLEKSTDYFDFRFKQL